jgi:hypothetical protein
MLVRPPKRFITRMGCHRPRQPGCQPLYMGRTAAGHLFFSFFSTMSCAGQRPVVRPNDSSSRVAGGPTASQIRHFPCQRRSRLLCYFRCWGDRGDSRSSYPQSVFQFAIGRRCGRLQPLASLQSLLRVPVSRRTQAVAAEWAAVGEKGVGEAQYLLRRLLWRRSAVRYLVWKDCGVANSGTV